MAGRQWEPLSLGALTAPQSQPVTVTGSRAGSVRACSSRGIPVGGRLLHAQSATLRLHPLRRPQEELNPLPYHQVTSTAQSSRRSSAAERLNPDPHFLTSSGPTGVGYPLITGRSQDRNLPSAIEEPRPAFYRRGAEEARRAHNPEVVRSKRTAGTPRPKTCFLPAWRRGSAQGS